MTVIPASLYLSSDPVRRLEFLRQLLQALATPRDHDDSVSAAGELASDLASRFRMRRR